MQRYQWKSVLKPPYQYHFGVKLGTVPICIGIRITIETDIGLVETVLHIIIEPNFIGIEIGIGTRIGIRAV